MTCRKDTGCTHVSITFSWGVPVEAGLQTNTIVDSVCVCLWWRPSADHRTTATSMKINGDVQCLVIHHHHQAWCSASRPKTIECSNCRCTSSHSFSSYFCRHNGQSMATQKLRLFENCCCHFQLAITSRLLAGYCPLICKDKKMQPLKEWEKQLNLHFLINYR